MRLLRLYIGQYHVLSELELRFDPSQPVETLNDHGKPKKYHLDFLVGVNGTGKSTVLRILARIFKGLPISFDSLSDIPFILEYYLDSQKQKIRIANIHPIHKTKLDRYFVSTAQSLNDSYETDEPDENHLIDAIEKALLPERIIAYTTGNEQEWQQETFSSLLEGSTLETIKELAPLERSLQELPGWIFPDEIKTEGVEQKFRLVQQEQLSLVTLTGLLLHSIAKEKSPLADVLEKIEYQDLAGFSLQFNLSYASPNERWDIWQKFGQYASSSLRNGGDFLLVFDLDKVKIKDLLKANTNALSLFETLAGWYSGTSRLLSKVNLFLERAPKKLENSDSTIPPLHTWSWMSDGERSFLGRMCLFMLFGEVESLLLLDEPEVHFNDYWKRHIVSMMDNVFELKNATHRSHVLVATHSSISLSDVQPEDILILERRDVLTSQTSMPTIKTFGADPGDIMVHVFGAPHASGEYSVNQVEDWLSQAYKEKDNDKRIKFLEEKLAIVAPGYWAYRIRREMVELTLQ